MALPLIAHGLATESKWIRHGSSTKSKWRGMALPLRVNGEAWLFHRRQPEGHGSSTENQWRGMALPLKANGRDMAQPMAGSWAKPMIANEWKWHSHGMLLIKVHGFSIILTCRKPCNLHGTLAMSVHGIGMDFH